MAKDHFEEIVSTIVLSGTVHKLVRQMSIELQISLVYLICSFTVSDYQIKPKGRSKIDTPFAFDGSTDVLYAPQCIWKRQTVAKAELSLKMYYIRPSGELGHMDDVILEYKWVKKCALEEKIRTW